MSGGRWQFGAALGAAGLLLAACSSPDGEPGKTTAAASPTGGATGTAAATAQATPADAPTGKLVVIAAEVGAEVTGDRTYPLVDVITVEADSGREIARFGVGGSRDFLTPQGVFLAGESVVTVGEGRVVRWSLDGRELQVLVDWREDQRPTTSALSHDGELLAVGWEPSDLGDREKGGLLVLEAETGKVVREWSMADLGGVIGAWPAPMVWHADDGGVEVLGFAHNDGPGVFASVRLDGTVTRRGPQVATVDPGGRLIALAPGGWTIACESLGLAAKELVFADPVTGREAGRASVDGFALWPTRFAPGADAVLLHASPVRQASARECFDWSAGEWLLLTLATGKTERVTNPAAVAEGWNDPALPTFACASWGPEDWERVAPTTATRRCSGSGELRLGTTVLLRGGDLNLRVLGIVPGR